MARARILASMLLAAVAGQAFGDDAVVTVLSRDGDGIVAEQLVIAEGQMQVIQYSPDGVIAVITPSGPGISGDARQLGSAAKMLMLRNTGDELELTRMVEGGEREQLPPVRIESLDDFDVRVSVVGADGPLGVFLIPAGGKPRPDTVVGPTDLFRGQIPLNAGDYVLTTEVYRVPAERVRGTFAMVVQDGRLRAVGKIGGEEVSLIIDTGGGSEIVLVKDAVPEGIELSEATMSRRSGGAVEKLPMDIGGARGSVQITGVGTLESLGFGDVVFHDVPLMVVDGKAAQIISERLGADGIIGMPLLRRGGVVDFDFAGGTVTLGGDAIVGGTQVSPAMSHLVFAAEVNGVPMPMVLDTGAPMCFVNLAGAAAAGVEPQGDAVQAAGLEGKDSSFEAGVMDSLSLAGSTLADVPVRIGDLPVVGKYGELGGMIGVSYLERFGRLRIDFDQFVVSLEPDDG